MNFNLEVTYSKALSFLILVLTTLYALLNHDATVLITGATLAASLTGLKTGAAAYTTVNSKGDTSVT